MPSTRSPVRDALAAYLERHPAERDALGDLLAALDAGADPAGRPPLPAHITCSAVVVDRHRRVLHVRPEEGGRARVPGGRLAAADRTLLAAALRGLHQETGIPPAALCHTAEYRDAPVDIGVHAVGTDCGADEPALLRYDFRMVLHLADDASAAAPRPDGAPGTAWLPFEEVACPALRAKLGASALDGRARPLHAAALIHDGEGRYLLHLRDDLPDIREPGSWALLGGGRAPQDTSLEDTVRRELREEAGLEPVALAPYAVENVVGPDGTTVPVQVFTGRWDGDPAALVLTETVMAAWHAPRTASRLRMDPSTRALILRHAEEYVPPAGGGGRGAVPHVVGVHLYLERGGRVLLGLRHPDCAYAGAAHHFLAGHCEQESAVDCLVREAREEAGLVIEPADVELVHLVHVADRPGGRPRMQLVFRARHWAGEPRLLEPDRCVSWDWWPPDALPEPIVPYARAAIEGIGAGRRYTELGWSRPGSAG